MLRTIIYINSSVNRYIRAPSAVIETGLICNLKASVMHDRAVLGLNSHHMTVSPCPSPVGHGIIGSPLRKVFSIFEVLETRSLKPYPKAKGFFIFIIVTIVTIIVIIVTIVNLYHHTEKSFQNEWKNGKYIILIYYT